MRQSFPRFVAAALVTLVAGITTAWAEVVPAREASSAKGPTVSGIMGSGIAPCGIPYQPSQYTSIAHALLSPATGEPVILYSPLFIATLDRRGRGADVLRYLLQHECAHHVLGHIRAGAASPGMLRSMTKHLELEADCYAGRELAMLRDDRALRAGVMLWNSMGSQLTGPGYPTGLERSEKLQSCFSDVVAAQPAPGF